MQKANFKTTTITISLITTLLLVGCNTNSNNDSNYTSNDDPMETGHITATFTNKDGNPFVEIDADITGKDSTILPVATMNRDDIDTDDIKSIADSIFDNSEYYNNRPIEEYSIDELNTLISETESLKDIICTSDKTSPDANQVITGTSNYSKYNRNLEYYNSLISVANETPKLTSITDYSSTQTVAYSDNYYLNACNLVGTYNNLPCEMFFQQYDDNQCNATNLTISIDASNQLAWGNYNLNQLEYHVFSKNASYYYDISVPADNKCKYTIDEAILICDDMVKQLGIPDVSAAKYTNLVTTAYDLPLSDYFTLNTVKESGNCGYKIFYEKTINDVQHYTQPNTYNNFLPIFRMENDRLQAEYGYECLIFTVFDCGIVTVEYGNPLDIVDVTSNDAPLLDFDDVMSIANIAFSENYANNPYNTSNAIINISKIKLELMRVTTDETQGTYTLVPAWNFIDKDSSAIKISLNAIDGSILEVDNFGIIMTN